MRCSGFQVEIAREVAARPGSNLLASLEGFERVMWRDDFDMVQFKVAREQMQRCVREAYVELTGRIGANQG
jgi:hypothetical protein